MKLPAVAIVAVFVCGVAADLYPSVASHGMASSFLGLEFVAATCLVIAGAVLVRPAGMVAALGFCLEYSALAPLSTPVRLSTYLLSWTAIGSACRRWCAGPAAVRRAGRFAEGLRYEIELSGGES
jgi:hypothetical protein